MLSGYLEKKDGSSFFYTLNELMFVMLSLPVHVSVMKTKFNAVDTAGSNCGRYETLGILTRRGEQFSAPLLASSFLFTPLFRKNGSC